MNKIGCFFLNVSVALYLFANGIVGISREKILGFSFGGGEFGKMIDTIFKRADGDFKNILIIVLSVCAIAAGIFLLLSFFRIEISVTDIILLVFICLWLVFIVIVDIINPFQNSNKVKFLEYLLQLTPHLMVLGALITSTRRFGKTVRK
jgi:hypothetical protein